MIPTVTLGNSGIEVSEFCFGTGTNGWNGGSNQTRLGKKQFIDLMLYGYEKGIRFWDSADQYGSHPHVKEGLRILGRENVVFTTKTCATTKKETEKDIKRFLKETGTDYLDIVLMHCMSSADWPEQKSGVLEALSEAKEKGLIRAHGVSCHDFGAFQTASENPWVEVVLARINHGCKHMDASDPEVIGVMEKMHQAGKGIYGMKVVGAGALTTDVFESLAFVRELDCVHALVLGMVSREEIDENVRFFEEHSLVAV